MDFIFDRDPCPDTETYTVRMPVNDASGNRQVFGQAVRRDANTWEVTLKTARELPGGAFAVVIKAADVAELGRVMSARMGMLPDKFPEGIDALTDDAAETLTWGMLLTLNALCARTRSLAGYANGLSRAIAQLLAEDVKPANEAEFRAKLNENIDAHAAALRRKQTLEKAITTQLRAMFRDMGANDDEGGGPPSDSSVH